MDLTQKEAEIFEVYHANIKKEVDQLKMVLKSLEDKEKERSWLKNQTQGDLDESRVERMINRIN